MSSSTDAAAVLADTHAVLGWLTARISKVEATPAWEFLFDEWAKFLGGHLASMDNVVYRALHAAGWQDESGAAQEGHNRLREELAGAITCKLVAGELERCIASVESAIRNQVAREQARVMPFLVNELSDGERLLLGAEMQAHMFELSQQTPLTAPNPSAAA